MKKFLTLFFAAIACSILPAAPAGGVAASVNPSGVFSFLRVDSLGRLIVSPSVGAVTGPTPGGGTAIAVDPNGNFAYLLTDSTGALVTTGSGGGGGGNVSSSGTPLLGQVAEWTNAATIKGVATTGSNNYVKSDGATMATPTFTTNITTPKVIFTSGVSQQFGTGTPEGSVSASVGSLYLRTDGGTATTLYVKESGASNTGWAAVGGGGGGSGTVTSVSVTTANGVSGSVATSTTTPAITLTLGAITPTSVNSVVLSGSSTPTLAVTGTTTLSGTHSGTSSGTNTGDQTITLTGDATGSGTGSFATTLATVNSTVGSFTSANITVNAKGLVTAASNGSGGTGLADPGSNGVVVRTSLGTTTARTITGTANEVTLTNGDGVSGNPTVSLPSALTFTGKTVTNGTFTGAKLGSLTSNGFVKTGSGDGTLSVDTASYQPLDAALTALAAGSDFVQFSGPATSIKTFTLPNASATILTDNAVVTGAQGGTGVANSSKTITLGGNLTTSGAFATTFTSTGTTSVTLPTTGTLATLANAESLTNKKLGSLTSNGFVKTSAGDGTLSVDTATYIPTTGVGLPEVVQLAASDTTTAITAGTNKVTLRIPWAATLTAVRASVSTAPTGSTIIIDINKNGTTVLSTKLSIDASEKTSTTAAVPAVISVSSFSDDDEIEIDFDQVGSTVAGAGVVITLYFTRT